MKRNLVLVTGAAVALLSGCAQLDKLFDDDDAGQAGAAGQPQQQQQAAPQSQPMTQAEAPLVAVTPQMVRSVQQQLKAQGIDPGPVDGIWGPRTSQAVNQFQQKQGIDATGQLGTRTLAALGITGEQTASAGAGGTAQQQGGKPRFNNLDANEDGGVTLSEAAADTRISRDFKQADRNNDGKLSREEFQAALEMQASSGSSGSKSQ